MKHIMLDLETLGTGFKGAVVAIGACAFNPFKLDERGSDLDRFYCTVDIQSNIDAGMDIHGSTIKWWMEQSEYARKTTFLGDALPLAKALRQFGGFVGNVSGSNPRNVAVWGNGATFDNVIIRSAFAAVGMVPPWTFRNDKCYRTVVNLIPKDQRPPYPDTQGRKHNALDDAIAQAQYLCACYCLLGVKPA